MAVIASRNSGVPITRRTIGTSPHCQHGEPAIPGKNVILESTANPGTERSQSAACSNGHRREINVHGIRNASTLASTTTEMGLRQLRQPDKCPTCGRRLPRLLAPGTIFCPCGARVVVA